MGTPTGRTERLRSSWQVPALVLIAGATAYLIFTGGLAYRRAHRDAEWAAEGQRLHHAASLRRIHVRETERRPDDEAAAEGPEAPESAVAPLPGPAATPAFGEGRPVNPGGPPPPIKLDAVADAHPTARPRPASAPPPPDTGAAPAPAGDVEKPVLVVGNLLDGHSLIRGRARLHGDRPAPRFIDMSGYPDCQALHADPVRDEAEAVHADGTVGNVFVWISKGMEGATFTAPEWPVVLEAKGCLLQPRVFGIMVGQRFKIANRDPSAHVVKIAAAKNDDATVTLAAGETSWPRAFARPEVMVPIRCDRHGWMRAYAGVLPHPFYAVTDGKGRFSLPWLPAGTYTVSAWHEVYGTLTVTVTLAAMEVREIELSFGPR